MVIGEEIKNPARNIPLTLAITFAVVAIIYTLITLVLPSLIPWQQLGTMVAPMGRASQTFLPDWFATLITLSALLAAATSVNVAILTASRSFFALARNRIYPEILSRINSRSHEPSVAIVLAVLFALAGVAVQGDIIQYASVTVIGAMLYGIIWSIALIRLPVALPDHYRKAKFQLKIRSIWIIATIKISISLAFLYVGIRNNLGPAMIYFGLLGLGAVYYVMRKRYLDSRGLSLQDLLRREANQVLSG